VINRLDAVSILGAPFSTGIISDIIVVSGCPAILEDKQV